MYTLRERNFESFFRAPFNAYGSNSPYVSPLADDLARFLDAAQNPLFKYGGPFTYFSVERDGVPVGRIVAHVHLRSNIQYGESKSYFGYFDCTDDPDAARVLLTAAEDFGRAQGCTEIAGNFNLTAMQSIGVLVDGFEHAPFTDQVWSPPHVASLLRQQGYEACFPMTTHTIPIDEVDPAQFLGDKQRELLADPAFRVDPVSRRHLARDLDAARMILNDGFAQNPMFVPLTQEEFLFQAKDMMWIVDPRISAVARYNGEVIGALLCIPDLNPLLRSIGSSLSARAVLPFLRARFGPKDRAIIIYYSVARSFHNRGVNGVLMNRVFAGLRGAGYRQLGGTWIADINGPSLRQVEKIGGRPMHRLALFRKSLEGKGSGQ